jgi:hypothetical protein
MKTFTYILMYIWQILQNIIGLILIAWYKPQRMHKLDNGVEIHYSHKMTGGISLGNYCIVNTGHYRKDINESIKRDTVRHEAIGHTKQSRMLGPLYLIVIGLPSLIWCILYGLVIPYTKNGYYKFYTEKWADSLAGVKR